MLSCSGARAGCFPGKASCFSASNRRYKMRRTTETILLIALTALGWLEPSRAVAQTKIRLATLLPRGSSHYQILESMGQQWREASGGSINLTIYADGTMGGEAETEIGRASCRGRVREGGRAGAGAMRE